MTDAERLQRVRSVVLQAEHRVREKGEAAVISAKWVVEMLREVARG